MEEKPRTPTNAQDQDRITSLAESPGPGVLAAGDEKDKDAGTTEAQHAAVPDGPPPPPNGGYGWVCTACVATINAHTWGLNSSYGVFLAHYLASNTFPGASSLEYAFVGSLSVSCALLVSPIATICVRELGTKPTMFAGIVMETASQIGRAHV